MNKKVAIASRKTKKPTNLNIFDKPRKSVWKLKASIPVTNAFSALNLDLALPDHTDLDTSDLPPEIHPRVDTALQHHSTAAFNEDLPHAESDHGHFLDSEISDHAQ